MRTGWLLVLEYGGASWPQGGGQGVDVLLRLYDGCLHLAIWAGAD